MSFLTKEALLAIENHWAVASISPNERKAAKTMAEERFVQRALGEILPISGDGFKAPLVARVAMAYELAAVEGLDALLVDGDAAQCAQAKAGAHEAFALRRGLPLPADASERVFHVLHLAALAYCGERDTDLRRWLKETPDAMTPPSVATVSWEHRVMFRLFECWISLFRKDKWDDLDRIREAILGLRHDQKTFEAKALAEEQGAHPQCTALRLVALYHWAKATELLATYMMQGEPVGISTELDKHYEEAGKAAQSSTDRLLEVLLRWLHVASRQMVAASVWHVARKVNSRVTKFVSHATRTRSLFELLPPQRAAVQEQGLLDPAAQAVVVNLPTSGGKTILAQFRILQALNQFAADGGWVAYVAPTRALVAQVTRRLRQDFEPLGIHVEQLTSAVEVDGHEETLLGHPDANKSFHVLVTTPEKLSMVIRNKKVPASRPLALVVLDEAHNIEDESRGVRIELLLATIKGECASANFLLLMPYVPNAGDLAKWLDPRGGKTISLGTSAWMPNERVIGMFAAAEMEKWGDWQLQFETLATTHKTIQLRGKHVVGGVKPLNVTRSDANPTTQAAAMAQIFSKRGTSVAIGRTIRDVWSMARKVQESFPPLAEKSGKIVLVQNFLATEISPTFELIGMLDRGVGVHHSGLSEEARALIEWLAESGELRVLCATTTLAQGINFPVSSVFLASIHQASDTPRKDTRMPHRAFWNLAGRAGRIQHDSVGVVGIAAGNKPNEVRGFVRDKLEDIVSRLVSLAQDVEKATLPGGGVQVIHREEWADFRSYIAHLWSEKKNLDAVLAETEQVLRRTYGYGALPPKTKAALLEATKGYASKLAEHPENAMLADSTGFAPEGVRTAMLELGKLENKLRASDWTAKSLFGSGAHSALPSLIGVMMKIPQISNFEKIAGQGDGMKHVAEIAMAWVGGRSIDSIAKEYFPAEKGEKFDLTDAITKTCQAIYRNLAMDGTWGLSALSKMPTSGLKFDEMTPEAKRAVNSLPAMLYHGVKTEEAVMMRMNAVPRSIAEALGAQFSQAAGGGEKTVREAREFLRGLKEEQWAAVAPAKAKMSGREYRRVWGVLSGEGE